METDVGQPITYLKAHEEQILETLKTMSRIKSVSAEGYPPDALVKSAESVATAMREAGLYNVEVIPLPGAHPYAYGEWLGAPGAPTLLLYGHHDVQPPGREEKWLTPAFEPTIRDGRMYGRGVVDDKAGVMVHVAACAAYLKTVGKLPVNVKFIVEGEEECGSDHLEEFLAKYKSKLAADFIVLTDTANLAAGVPSITYALRGLVAVEVEVAGLDHPVHSGMWGGPVPDPVMAMAKILARLVDDHGAIQIPGIYDRVRASTPAERAQLAALPFDETQYCADAGMLAGVQLTGEPGFTVYERNWTRPSLAITALEASPILGSSNQLVSSARARVGIRIVPHMDATDTQGRLVAALTKDPPWGVQVKVTPLSAAGAWLTEPAGPAYEAAARAMTKGFGNPAVFIGCGGTIPFVQPFADQLGGVPALLIGLEDPICNAHSENESLNLDDFRKAMASAVYLYDELSRCPTKAVRT